MGIEEYELYDFLADESFRKWAENSDAAEGDLWQTMLRIHPEKKYLAEAAKQIIRSGEYKDLSLEKAETHALWKQIRKDALEENRVSKPKKKGWNLMLRVAAVIVPLIAIGFFFLFSSPEPAPVPQPQAEKLEKRTQKGQKLQITFSDGTKVKLNADSKLIFERPFAPHLREVYLEGEAYFDVAHNPDRPFVVQTGNISTKVLGTSFNIRTYPEDDVVKVAVVTGKVLVEGKNEAKDQSVAQSILIEPSEMVTYDKKKLTAEVASINIDEIVAWNKDILIFNNARFSEVVDQLERWYGVEFKMERKTPIKKGFRGTFENKSLEHVLNGISYTSDFQYELRGNTVIIK